MQLIKILTIAKPEFQYLLSESTQQSVSDLEAKIYVKFRTIYPQKHKGPNVN